MKTGSPSITESLDSLLFGKELLGERGHVWVPDDHRMPHPRRCDCPSDDRNGNWSHDALRGRNACLAVGDRQQLDFVGGRGRAGCDRGRAEGYIGARNVELNGIALASH